MGSKLSTDRAIFLTLFTSYKDQSHIGLGATLMHSGLPLATSAANLVLTQVTSPFASRCELLKS